ncbi:hypothetical protein BDN70DRAFT_84388 [Pholiota conissans]|uniref:Uncharacterized protein n=1 Tax=Pholiota conissans TaxID=109636 RepID=A0A9P5ZBN1_9AGAR|nr:hypothetical protein BDN70DRAFT_84388 [Pholiota conissans]
MPCMDTLFEECRCELSTCPFTVCRIKLAKLHPRQAVAEARQESAASPFVLKIATATLRDARYRRSDAATMFIRHILEGEPTDGEAPHWDYAVLGLFNVFASIDADKSGYRDAGIKREILNAYPKIMEVVSRDIDLLSGPEPNIERRRAIVCGLIAWCTTETVMQKTMYDEYSLKIVIHCWLHSPPPDQNRRSIAMVPIEQILHPYAKAGPCYKPPPNHVYDTIQSFGMTTFVSLISNGERRPRLLGSDSKQGTQAVNIRYTTTDKAYGVRRIDLPGRHRRSGISLP